MIRIELDEVTVARTRIATSPLWETVCSLLLLSRNPTDVPWPYTAWAERARRVLATVPAAAPARLYGGQLDGSSPDFFDGVPTSPAPTLEEELERVCATDPQVIAEQLAKHYPDGVPPALVPFRDTPGPALRRLADGVLAYWEGAIAPYWPAMRAALEEEVLLRARAPVRRGLPRPSTPAGLALARGLAPGTVSEHLSGLLAAGVAPRRRIGRRVLYGLEPSGRALLSLLDSGADDRAAG